LTGSAPVSELGDYAEKLGSYTKGRGRLLFEMGGYRPCHNMEETVAQFGYDPDADKRNPAASVFCSHGAGVIVPWNEVRDHMHVDTGWREGVTSSDGMFSQSGASRAGAVNAEEERVFVAAGDGRRMEDEIGAGQEKRKGADGKGRADVGGAGVEGAPMDNDAGTKEQPVGSDAGDGAREAGSGRGAAEGRLPKKLAGQGMSEGGIHLQDEMSMDAETDDSQYASAGYGSVGIRASRALEPAADLQDYKERQRAAMAEEEELKSIFERTYGPIKSSIGPAADTGPRRVASTGERGKFRKPKPRPEKEYLLVDGYNILFAWDEFRTLARADMKAARDALLERLSNYAGFAKKNLICVFDAYRVAGGNEQVYRYHNIDVIFTREAETADQYIEKAAHELSRQYQVTVATSDAIEQIIIYGAGAIRLSARNFLAEVESAVREMQKTYIAQDTDRSQTVGSSVGEEIRKALERQGN
ncbi:MAG: NYN domain-containing protein, partial [Lachnospiraceae bacterium]|nr:NYN domain-containing protein [Lachnospiraceae bacterium]